MSGDAGDNANHYDVGYGKPPRSGQFQKGRSGNPTGRPRKTQTVSAMLPMVQPTREIMSKVAAKSVAVREGDQRSTVTGTEAVMQSLLHTALKGGVLAQRTFLEYQLQVDDRNEERKRKSFEFWTEYVRRERAEIAKAQRKGLPLPEPIPHPDNIEFEPLHLEVRFTGAMNLDQHRARRKIVADLKLFSEILLYHASHYDMGLVADGYLINPFQLIWNLDLERINDREMQEFREFMDQLKLELKIARVWRRDLVEKFSELGFEGDPTRRLKPLDLRSMGKCMVGGRLVQYRRSKHDGY